MPLTNTLEMVKEGSMCMLLISLIGIGGFIYVMTKVNLAEYDSQEEHYKYKKGSGE